MTEDVVHLLETVKVDAEQGKAVQAVACVLQHLPQLLVEPLAVGQLGQCVMLGKVRDPGFRLPALGHILDHEEQIAGLPSSATIGTVSM